LGEAALGAQIGSFDPVALTRQAANIKCPSKPMLGADVLNLRHRTATPADLQSMMIRSQVLENLEDSARPMPAEVRRAALLQFS